MNNIALLVLVLLVSQYLYSPMHKVSANPLTYQESLSFCEEQGGLVVLDQDMDFKPTVPTWYHGGFLYDPALDTFRLHSQHGTVEAYAKCKD